MTKKIPVKVEATAEQIAELQRLKKNSRPVGYNIGSTGGLVGKFLLKNYGKEISEALSKQQDK